MTNEEVKNALFQKSVVSCNIPHIGTFSDMHVSAVIYRVVEKRLYVSAELADKGGRSVIIVKPEWIKAIKQKENAT